MALKKKKLLRVSIRTLAEITFADGSLGGTAPAGISSQLGIEIHLKYQNRGIKDYRSEVHFKRIFEGEFINLEVSGNADGIYPSEDGIHIEEIKTMRFGIENTENGLDVHSAQLKLYGLFYCSENDTEKVILDLIYYNRSTAEEKIFTKEYTKDQLEAECTPWIEAYLHWNDLNAKHRIELHSDLKELTFPFSDFRPGQRYLSKAVYCTIRDKKILYAEAPTGTGKTAAVMFPALKAVSENLTDKIFYLTAKNAGAETAEKTAELINRQISGLRWISITAKAKICFTNENDSQKPDCNPEYCPYSLNYYKRLPEAMNSVFTETSFSRNRIESIAENFKLCPFELSLDIALFCDLIIADYNYAFDFSSKLKRFFSNGKTNHTFLIDEAHNIIDRTRAMFSSEMTKSRVAALKKDSEPPLKNVLSLLNSEFIYLRKQYGSPSQTNEKAQPDSLIKSARKCMREFDLYIEQHGQLPGYIADFYWELLQFTTVSEHYSDSYRTIIQITKNDVTVKLACIDPAYEIQEVLKNQKSAVFFSATLSPLDYYKALISSSMENYSVSLPSPFDSDNCLHFIKTDLSTRYKFREINSAEYACTVKNIIETVKGNIVIFSPSFTFQKNLLNDLGLSDENDFLNKLPDPDVIIQSSQMTNSEKETFLNEFHTRKNLRAFCVSGGSFAESIDLPGDKLIGVIIFGVGLPQVNFDNDVIKQYFDEKYNNGYSFAYMYPGFNKVLQAAGRVIRTEEDKGFVLLIDDRYNTPEYRKLIPKHWKLHNYTDSNSAVKLIQNKLNQ
ncbi:MAG: ATP-dependent DNA helicase [Spirochaetes bacterium]|nr:ATP-dependent DNA helicase [Spirochaetota bacterium]